MTDWFDGFDRIDGVRDYGEYRRGDLPLFLLRHTWEGIGATAQWHKDYVRKRMRNARPHFVVANPHTTALAYQKSYGGSKARVSDSEIKEGYEYLGQAQPTDGPSWSLRGIYYRTMLGKKKPRYVIIDGQSVRVESNHANVWQTEFVSYAADMRNLTDEELEWERDKVWLPQVRAGGLTEVVPWERVGSNKKIPDEVWMSPERRKEFNFGGHQHIPPPNDHWDSGPYPYGEMADELNKVLKDVGARVVGSRSTPAKVSVAQETKPAVSTATDTATDKLVKITINTPQPRPQDVGRARSLIVEATKTLATAEKYLNPKQ